MTGGKPNTNCSVRWNEIGEGFFASLLRADGSDATILACEQVPMHSEHLSNPEVVRWRITYRSGARRQTTSFVAKRLQSRGSREIATLLWLQTHTTVNTPTLVCCRTCEADGESWMLTENWVNFNDAEFDYLCPLFFTPASTAWPRAVITGDRDEAFVAALSDLHGKTLSRHWLGDPNCPIPSFGVPDRNALTAGELLSHWQDHPWVNGSPGDAEARRLVELAQSVATPSQLSHLWGHVSVCHGSVNYQEVGFRLDPGFPPQWGLFDWETFVISPIYFDLSRLHYVMGKPLDADKLGHYVSEVARLSGTRLDDESVRECMAVAAILPSPGLGGRCEAMAISDLERLEDLLESLSRRGSV